MLDAARRPSDRADARRRLTGALSHPAWLVARLPPLDHRRSAADGRVHFGILLRRARGAARLAMSDVADKTRISPRWIRAIEEAQLDILPPGLRLGLSANPCPSGRSRRTRPALSVTTRWPQAAQAQTRTSAVSPCVVTDSRCRCPLGGVPGFAGADRGGADGLWLTNTFWRR